MGFTVLIAYLWYYDYIELETETEIDRFEDKSWDEIKTPIKVDVYEDLLIKSGYDKQKTQFLVSGFKEGFDICYEGPQDQQDVAKNMLLRGLGTRTDLWNKLMKEVKLGQVSGPYKKEDLPFESYIQSPIGLVPKSGGQTRLIFHLSYDFKDSGNKSLNGCMPKDKCTVKYNHLDHAIEICLRLIEEAGLDSAVIVFSKSDLKSAFRILCIKPSQRKWLLMKAQDPETGEVYFFIDKCLPFGVSISCALFQDFSDSLKYLVEFKINRNRTRAVTNYLDDFLFMALLKLHCDRMLKLFIELCEQINCLIAMDKTEWGSIRIVFLGVLPDGRNHCLAIPEDKRIKALNQLNSAVDKKKITIREIQSLTGLLNFLSRAIMPGRAFTCRMYIKLSGIDNGKLK